MIVNHSCACPHQAQIMLHQHPITVCSNGIFPQLRNGRFVVSFAINWTHFPVTGNLPGRSCNDSPYLAVDDHIRTFMPTFPFVDMHGFHSRSHGTVNGELANNEVLEWKDLCVIYTFISVITLYCYLVIYFNPIINDKGFVGTLTNHSHCDNDELIQLRIVFVSWS